MHRGQREHEVVAKKEEVLEGMSRIAATKYRTGRSKNQGLERATWAEPLGNLLTACAPVDVVDQCGYCLTAPGNQSGHYQPASCSCA